MFSEDDYVLRQEVTRADRLTRRRSLTVLVSITVAALAGCSALNTDEETPNMYEHLQRHPVYIDEDIKYSIPESVQIVDSPTDAVLIVLPSSPDIGVFQAVEWLEQSRTIALVGDETQSTWRAWIEADAFEDTFDTAGIPEPDPETQLLIAWNTDSSFNVQEYKWSPGPSDDDILSALDDTLGNIES